MKENSVKGKLLKILCLGILLAVVGGIYFGVQYSITEKTDKIAATIDEANAIEIEDTSPLDGNEITADAQDPQITLSAEGNSVWAKSHSVVVTLSDNIAGLASGIQVRYGWSTSNTEAPSTYTNATITYSVGDLSTTFTANGSGLTGKYYLWVEPLNDSLKDTLGHILDETQISDSTFYFDNRGPWLAMEAVTNNESWRKEHQIKVTAWDGEVKDPDTNEWGYTNSELVFGLGLKSGATFEYGWSQSAGTLPTSWTTVDLATKTSYSQGALTTTYTFTTDGGGLTGKWFLHLKQPVAVQDVLGNSNQFGSQVDGVTVKHDPIEFYFDNTAPTATFSPNPPTTGTRYVKGGTAVTVTMYDEHAGLISNSQIQYQWVRVDASGNFLDANGNTLAALPTTWSTLTGDPNKAGNTAGVNSVEYTIPASQSSSLNGIYKLYLKEGITKDNVGDSTKNTNIQYNTANFYFDNTIPTITLTPNTEETWFIPGRDIQVSIKDNEGAAGDDVAGLDKDIQIQYQWTTSTVTPSSGWQTALKSGTTSTNAAGAKETTRTIPASASANLTGVYYLHIKAGTFGDYVVTSAGTETDNLNAKQTSALFRFDNTLPTITLGSQTDTTWAKSHSVTVTLKDSHSGLGPTTLNYGWSTSNTTAPDNYTAATPAAYTEGTSLTTTFTANGSGLTGKYYLWVVPVNYRDAAENDGNTSTKDGNQLTEATVSTGTFYFDNTKPVIGLSPNTPTTGTRYVKGGVEIEVRLSDEHAGMIKDAQIEYQWVKSDASPSSSGWLTALKPGTATTNDAGITGDKDGTNTPYITRTIPASASSSFNGTYKLYIREGITKDNVRETEKNTNTQVISENFYFDNEGPKITTFSPTKREQWLKAGQEVAVTLTDNLAGFDKDEQIEYQWVIEGGTPSASNWKTTVKSGTTNANNAGVTTITRTIPASGSEGLTGKYYLCIKSGSAGDYVVTSAGAETNNTSESAQTTGLFWFDNSGPVVTFNPNNQLTYSKQGAEVEVTFTDNHAGLAANIYMEYKWIREDGTEVADWARVTGTNSANATSTTRIVPAEASSTGLTGEYYLHIRAGTASDTVSDGPNWNVETVSGLFRFDNVGTRIEISPTSQENWTKGTAITVTGTDDDSGLQANAKIQYQWVLEGETPDDDVWIEIASDNEEGAETTTWEIPKSASSSLTSDKYYHLYIREGTLQDNVTDTETNYNLELISGGFHFDAEKPIIEFVANSQPDSYTRATPQVEVRISDEHSGLSSNIAIQYQWILVNAENKAIDASGNILTALPNSWSTVTGTNTAGITGVSDTSNTEYITRIVPAGAKTGVTGTYSLFIKAGCVRDNVTDSTAYNVNNVANSDIYKLDYTKPTVTFSPNEQTSYSKRIPEVTVTLRDEPAGLEENAEIKYQWVLVNEAGEPIDENGDVLAELPNTWTTKTATNAAGASQTTITIATATTTYTGYYKLYVKAGSVIDNVTDSTTENSNAVTSSAIFKFDNENPEIVSFTPNSQTGSWSRGAAVTVTAQDYYSGFASDVTLEYQWVLVNDAGNPISASGTVLGTLPTSWTTLEASEVTAAANYGDPHIAKWVIEKNISAGLSGKYKLYIKEGSVADNVTETTKNTNVGSSSSGIFQFDNKSPVIAFDITTTGENWVKGGQPVKVTATDIHSGLIVGDDLKMEFQWVAQGQTPSSSNWISSDSLADPERPDEYNATWTIPASYTENLTGIYKLYIRAEITKDNITDTTKNSNAEASTEEFKFDNTKPNKVATSTIKLGSASGANYPHEQEPLPWTSSDVYVKPNNDAEDQHSGVKESIVTILKDGEEYTPTNDLLLETGIYEITIVTYDNAIDSSGNANPNTDTRTYTIKIDKDKPIITTITPNSYGDNNTWIRGHEVVVTAKDDLAGLKANAKIQYQWVKQGQTPADDSWTEISSTNTAGALETTWTIPKSESQKDTINGKYILYIREGITQDNVLDTVGNGNSQKTSGIFYFDNEKPSITFSIDPAEDWIRGEQPLTVTATDTYAGLIANAQIQYQWVIEGQTPSSSKWVQLQASNEARVNSVTWSVEMKDSNGQQISSGRYILYIREGITKDNVTDTEKNANAETTAGVFKFDNTAPNNVATMTIKLGNSSGTDYPYDQEQNWTKSDVYIALNDNATDEHSGVKQSTFAVTKDGEAYTPTGNLLKHTGTYTITVTTEDNAVFASGEGPGNIATRTYTVRIDKEAPVVTGFAPESQTGVDSWSRGTEVTVTATDTEAGFISNVAIQYQWVKEGEAPVTANWTLITATDDGDGSANTAKWVVDKTASATLTGEYRLYIKEASINDNVIDSAKNTNSGVSKSGIFYFDNSAPEITFDINTKTDWVKDGQKIIVTATDANAGLIKDSNALLIQYQWVVDGSAPTSGGWSSAIAPFEENVVDEYIRSAKWEVPASSSSGLSGTYKLYIKSGITKDNITDSTKNSNIQASTGTFNFDNIIPNNVATMNFKLESTTGSDYVHGTWTNKDVYMSLNDDAEDAHSGVRESTYTVLKDGAEYTPVDEVLTETGVYTITVTTEDNAVTQDGNEPGNTAARTYTIQIDKVDPISKPLIMKENNASGADYGNDTWTKEDVYIEKVDGEDQAELSGHKITYYTIEKKQDDGTYEIYSGGYSGSSGGTGSTSSTLASVTNANIGDYINLGNNIVGTSATTDDWRILYVEGDTVYAILADYLPNSTGYAENAGLDISKSETEDYVYSVYSKTNRDTLLNGLTTESNWNGLANGISGATVTGTPTAELLMKSYNAKNGTNVDYIDRPTLDNTTEDYDLYVPHTSPVSSCLRLLVGFA